MSSDLTCGEIIVARNTKWNISKEEFWHLVSTETDLEAAIKETADKASPSELCMTLNNIFLHEGLYYLKTVLDDLPALQYTKSHNEDIFEQIRKSEYPNRPCRYKCVYLFKNKEDAENKNIEWFDQRRKIIKCHIVCANPLFIFQADSNHISMIKENSNKEEIENIARKYWNGELLPNSCIEVLVDGALYFPAWREFSEFDLRPQQNKIISKMSKVSFWPSNIHP